MVLIVAFIVFVCVRGGGGYLYSQTLHQCIQEIQNLGDEMVSPVNHLDISPSIFLLVATVGEYGNNSRNDFKTNKKSKYFFLHLNLYGLVGINIFMVPCLSIKHAGT